MPQQAQRHVLRPEHFTIAPQLLGLPLASPARRLAALLLDLVVVAILVQAGGAFLLGIAAAWAFFRVAGRARKPGAAPGSATGTKRMWALRAVGAFILFLVVRSSWNHAQAFGASMLGSPATHPETAKQSPARAVVSLGTGMAALQTAPDPGKAAAAAKQVVGAMRATGASDQEIREALAEVAAESEQPWMRGAVDEAIPPAQQGDTVPAESLAVRHAAALGRGDRAAADSLRPLLASALARDSLDGLRERVDELREAERTQRERAERAENRGFLPRILQLLDEMGIGFGWTGLYFTTLTTLWRGQTPGKRLMGIRVVRLNGEPMTYWMSFERFGGYAAGLFTGLLGFAQVFWDRNRQAIHDKITETVVVREQPGAAQPPSAPAPAAEPTAAARPRYRAPT